MVIVSFYILTKINPLDERTTEVTTAFRYHHLATVYKAPNPIPSQPDNPKPKMIIYQLLAQMA